MVVDDVGAHDSSSDGLVDGNGPLIINDVEEETKRSNRRDREAADVLLDEQLDAGHVWSKRQFSVLCLIIESLELFLNL